MKETFVASCKHHKTVKSTCSNLEEVVLGQMEVEDECFNSKYGGFRYKGNVSVQSQRDNDSKI